MFQGFKAHDQSEPAEILEIIYFGILKVGRGIGVFGAQGGGGGVLSQTFIITLLFRITAVASPLPLKHVYLATKKREWSLTQSSVYLFSGRGN